jgi:hypothetical protein
LVLSHLVVFDNQEGKMLQDRHEAT